MDQPIDLDLALNGHFYLKVRPSQVTHRLTDDGFSHFDYGPWRVAIRATDLTQVRAARQLAQAISAQAGFWDSDLAVIEARLQAELETHIATAPTLSPFDEPDPELDTAFTKVAELIEANRDGEEGEL
jgi:hypothetical protein